MFLGIIVGILLFLSLDGTRGDKKSLKKSQKRLGYMENFSYIYIVNEFDD